jgi:hypothetical protein
MSPKTDSDLWGYALTAETEFIWKTCKRHHLAALTQVVFPPAAVSIRDRLASVDGECRKSGLREQKNRRRFRPRFSK